MLFLFVLFKKKKKKKKKKRIPGRCAPVTHTCVTHCVVLVAYFHSLHYNSLGLKDNIVT